LGITSTKASDFDRNLDLPVLCEQQTTSGQKSVGGRRLLLTSNFLIEISFKFEIFYLNVTQKYLQEACKIVQAAFIG